MKISSTDISKQAIRRVASSCAWNWPRGCKVTGGKGSRRFARMRGHMRKRSARRVGRDRDAPARVVARDLVGPSPSSISAMRRAHPPAGRFDQQLFQRVARVPVGQAHHQIEAAAALDTCASFFAADSARALSTPPPAPPVGRAFRSPRQLEAADQHRLLDLQVGTRYRGQPVAQLRGPARSVSRSSP